MERKDKYRYLPWKEYNIALATDERRREIAIKMLYELVERGYAKETAVAVIKSTYLIDLGDVIQ